MTFDIYSMFEGRIYKHSFSGAHRLLSSDDEYWTALEWLTERGWL